VQDPRPQNVAATDDGLTPRTATMPRPPRRLDPRTSRAAGTGTPAAPTRQVAPTSRARAESTRHTLRSLPSDFDALGPGAAGSRKTRPCGRRRGGARATRLRICAHCHATNLAGAPAGPGTDASPPLQIVAAYSPEAFTQLLRTGAALGDRKLGMMREVTLASLSKLTDQEIADLYTYLRALAPPPGAS